MTQKEAVKQLKAWLPNEAYISDRLITGARTVYDIWLLTRIAYTSPSLKPLRGVLDDSGIYHFSQIPCSAETFLNTPCICIKVGKNNHILSFTQHLPYQSDFH